jgi:hypothetical protein
MKISVILSEDDADRFDRYCSKMGYKKSTLIVRLIRDHLAEQQFELQLNMLDQNDVKIEQDQSN